MTWNNLTDREKRIKVSECCTWRHILDSAGEHFIKPNETIKQYILRGDRSFLHDLPDYLNDLNAMHEAEKTLNIVQQVVFHRNLAMICDNETVDWGTTHAPPAKRAEAFAKTVEDHFLCLRMLQNE